MVLLTIVAPSNPHTVYFDHDIAKPNYIRLLSASIYNSWHNLTENAAVSSLPDGNGSTSRLIVPPGYYNIDRLAEQFNNMKNIKSNLDLTVYTNMSTGAMVITNPNNLKFTKNLVKLLGTDPSVFIITYVKRLTTPTLFTATWLTKDKTWSTENP